MNNVYSSTNRKMQERRHYSKRTSLMVPLLVVLLQAIDRILNAISVPAVKRVIKGIIVVGCLVAFLCLISAMEQQALSVFPGIVLSLFLVFVEILCLH